MRDDVLDRVFQPAVDRWDLPVDRLSRELACAYGALMVASVGARFDLLQSSWIVAFLAILIDIALTKAILSITSAGSSVLSSPLAWLHLICRMAMLGLGAWGVLESALALAIVPMDGDGVATILASLACDAAQFCGAASLYLALCDRPPPRRRRDGAGARA